MSTASVSELKARLPVYLRVAADRVADQGTDNRRRERLIASGVLRPGTGIDLAMQPLPVLVELVQALEEERTERL